MADDERRAVVRCQFCETWNRIDAARAGDRPKCGKCGRPMLVDRPVPLNDETFARTVQESTVPVVVDCYADWCAPCKMMAPAVHELAQRRIGDVLVAKLNTDLAPATARELNIRGIPTMIVFRGGQEVSRVSGAMPLPQLERFVAQAVG